MCTFPNLISRLLATTDTLDHDEHEEQLAETVEEVRASNQPAFGNMADRLGEALEALRSTSVWMIEQLQGNPEAALAGATPYLRLFGLTTGGVYLAKGALLAARDSGGPGRDQIALARFFAETQVPLAGGIATSITDGADSLLAVPVERLSA